MQRRTPTGRRRSDVVVAVVGLLVIAAAAATLLVVEERAGPYTADLAPAAVSVDATGQYESVPAQESSLPGGICDETVPGGECQPARTVVDWDITGLPDAPAGAVYAAWSVGDDHPIGVLERDGDVHAVSYDEEEEREARAFRLVLTTDPGDTDAPHLVLHEVALQDDGPTDLAGTFDARPDVQGTARFTQIGAADVSLLADAAVDAPDMPGLTYRVWLIGDDVQALGDLVQRDGKAVLDERIERVRVAPGDLLLVTIEADGAADEAPRGFPVAQGIVE